MKKNNTSILDNKNDIADKLSELIKLINHPNHEIQTKAVKGINTLAAEGNETAQIIIHAINDGPVDETDINSFLDLVNSDSKKVN